ARIRTPRRRQLSRRNYGTLHRDRGVGDLLAVLVPLARDTMASRPVARALEVFGELGLDIHDGDQSVHIGLNRGRIDLLTLWRVTDVHPLWTTVARMDRELHRQHPYLERLLVGGPLPSRARELTRYAPIAQARSIEITARRVRLAIGRLARGA